MASRSQEKGEEMMYRHTHVSVNDGSPAMFVSQTEDTITLVNEDGFEWTDPRDQWEHIEPENLMDKIMALLNTNPWG